MLLFYPVRIGMRSSRGKKSYSFNEVESISTVNVPTDDSIFMRYPFRLAKNDSLLFILDLHAPDHFIHVFSEKALKYHRSLCAKGDGPNEFISINNIQLVGDSLYVYESRNEIWVYQVDDIYQKKETPKRITLTKDFGFLSRGLKIRKQILFSGI